MNPAAPRLVPELLVSDISKSLEFWCGLCGFGVEYQREEERFAYISLGSAHVMLDQEGLGRDWVTGPMDRPLGRGINFQISVPDLSVILASLDRAKHELFMQPETKWYGVSDTEEVGVRQFIVADPDGYLLRFQTSLDTRPLSVAR